MNFGIQGEISPDYLNKISLLNTPWTGKSAKKRRKARYSNIEMSK